MVCTRSGKSTYEEAQKVVAALEQPKRVKKIVTKVVTEQSPADIQNGNDIMVEKKRQSPVKMIVSEVPSPKRQKVSEPSTAAAETVANPIQDKVKKIGITEDEKNMNGAPEGDLFDVILLENGQLQPLDGTVDPTSELRKQIQLYNETTVWAEKYECITAFRRIVLHHSNVLETTMESRNALLQCLVDGLQSLRSCNARNALLCIKQYCTINFDGGKQEGMWSLQDFTSLVTVLLNRLGASPKFLCDATFDVAATLFECCPPSTCVGLLSNFVNHRNIDISWKSIQLLESSFKQITKSSWEEYLQELAMDNTQSTKEWMKMSLTTLSLAMSSKKPQGKDLVKDTWKTLFNMLGTSQFTYLLEKTLTVTQSSEIQRELQKVIGISSTTIPEAEKTTETKAARVPLKALIARPINTTNTTSAVSVNAPKRTPFAAMKASFVKQKTNDMGVEDILVLKSSKDSVIAVTDENNQGCANVIIQSPKLVGKQMSNGEQQVLSPNRVVPYDFMLN